MRISLLAFYKISNYNFGAERLGIVIISSVTNMQIKLIACDLDGTLMSADHITVTEKTRKALFEAHEKGVKIAIATGRTLSVIYNVINQIPFIDYVVYSNGAAVYDLKKAKNIYTKYMPENVAADISDFLEKYPVYYEVYSHGSQHAQEDKAGYFKNKDLPPEFLEEYTKSINNHKSINDFAKHNDVEKINLYYFDGEYYNEIKDYLFSYPDIDCTSPVSGDIEMTYKGVDKADALSGICSLLGIAPENVMAFGDADNDIGMLRFAGFGFAMANAAEICKKNAKYITLSNEEDGVGVAVEKYVLGKKPKLLVSACLLGENCKYNGSNNRNEEIISLKESFDIIPVCPECFGGLKIPRVPNEIINGRAISKNGEDFTAEYMDGAEKTLYIAGESNAQYAVLKERSPSCGKGVIYDGTFSGTLTNGNGITAQLLIDNGIKVFGESEADKLLDEIEL